MQCSADHGIVNESSIVTRPETRNPGLQSRRRLCAEFFRNAVDGRQLLQPFEHLTGSLYFVKDAQSRLMAISIDAAQRMGYSSDAEIVGKRPYEYMPKDVADENFAHDQWVIYHGQPRLNVVEIWFDSAGHRDWIVADRYPLRDDRRRIVGLVGLRHNIETRRNMLAHLGAVGEAVDYIRDHLGDKLLLAHIAGHVGLSERQLQRHFRRVFHMTIQQFVIQSRIHAAIRELTQSNRSVTDIAMSLGFADQSAFSNRFREVTGMPPQRYRQLHLRSMTAPVFTRGPASLIAARDAAQENGT